MSQREQQTVRVALHREPEAQDLPLPAYATSNAAGMDICAAVPADSPMVLQPGTRALVPTGLRIALPPGYEAQIRPRSGLAARYGIGLVNAPGTIDADFRGEIQILLMNWGDAPFTIHRGDRVAQMVIAPVTRALWIEVASLDETERGEGGFGSTGVRDERVKG